MAIILRELEITYWYFFEPDKHKDFLYYLEIGLLRKYAYERVKQN